MDYSKIEPGRVFRKAEQCIVNVLIVYIIFLLAVGLGKTLLDVRFLVAEPVGGISFTRAVTNILSFLVIIELFRGFVDFFKAWRFRLHNMMDPALLFVVRELMVTLYEHKGGDWRKLVAFGILLLCMGIVRTLAVRFSPQDEEQMTVGAEGRAR